MVYFHGIFSLIPEAEAQQSSHAFSSLGSRQNTIQTMNIIRISCYLTLVLTWERPVSRRDEQCATKSLVFQNNSLHSFCHVPPLKCRACQWLQGCFVWWSNMAIKTIRDDVIRFGDISFQKPNSFSLSSCRFHAP